MNGDVGGKKAQLSIKLEVEVEADLGNSQPDKIDRLTLSSVQNRAGQVSMIWV